MSEQICSLLGIRYPIIMGGVSRTPGLGIAVSIAGGLGCIAGATLPSAQLREHIRTFQRQTDRPFSVNFPIVLTPADQLEEKMQIVVEERVPVVITSAGNPKLWTSRLQSHGIKVAHVLPTVYHATKAAEAGVDALIAEPAESGGYRGEHEVSMMVLIPAIRRRFPDLPLVAAGAVADGAGLAAVLALGADGVQLGTRLLASTEAEVAPHMHQLILAATDTSTMSAEGRVRPRVAKPDFTEQVLGVRRQVQMGQVAALIESVQPVATILQEMIERAREVSRDVQLTLDDLASAPA